MNRGIKARRQRSPSFPGCPWIDPLTPRWAEGLQALPWGWDRDGPWGPLAAGAGAQGQPPPPHREEAGDPLGEGTMFRLSPGMLEGPFLLHIPLGSVPVPGKAMPGCHLVTSPGQCPRVTRPQPSAAAAGAVFNHFCLFFRF